LAHAAEDDLIDLLWTDACPSDGRPNHSGGKIRRRGVGKAALKSPDGCARTTHQNYVFHIKGPSLSFALRLAGWRLSQLEHQQR
jgi:hypothetical protein